MTENFALWQAEDRTIETAAGSLLRWMREVEKFGKTRFGETAWKLQPFHDLLVTHFHRESRLLDELEKRHLEISPEVAAVRRQTERDQRHLLHDLEDFMTRLKQLEPPFESWQSAMREIDLFFDRLEQHEEQESNCLKALIPIS
jgi:hypothetical protein